MRGQRKKGMDVSDGTDDGGKGWKKDKEMERGQEKPGRVAEQTPEARRVGGRGWPRVLSNSP